MGCQSVKKRHHISYVHSFDIIPSCDGRTEMLQAIQSRALLRAIEMLTVSFWRQGVIKHIIHHDAAI